MASAHNNIGVLMVRKEAFKEAMFHFGEAERLMPGMEQARQNRKELERAFAKAVYGGR
jgi:hypothetical protein